MSCGKRARSSAALAWLVVFFGNEFHIVGGPLLYDYLAALVLMACAIHSNRPMTAGLALGYSAMTRVFPAFLLLGVPLCLGVPLFPICPRV